MHRFPRVSIFWGGVSLALILGLHLSSPIATTLTQKAAVLTAGLHFDFLKWTVNAVWLKFEQAAMGVPAYLDGDERKAAVLDYLQVTRDLEDVESRLDQIYADPAVSDKATATVDLGAQRDQLQERQRRLAPLAEAVLQAQVTEILGEEGLTARGQPLPAISITPAQPPTCS